MVKCLETKLMESVIDDGTLRKENEMRFDVHQVAETASGTQLLEVYNNAPGNVLTCLGGGTITVSGVEKTRVPDSGKGANIGGAVKNADFQVSVENKYVINGFKIGSSVGLDLSDLDGCTSLLKIDAANAPNVKGDICFLKDCPLTTKIELQHSQISGDIKNISATVGGVYLSDNPNLYGNIASFGKCTSVAYLWINNTGVTGSLEGLAQAQVANGRTSGTMYPRVIGTKVTYQGATLFTHKTIMFGSSMVNPTSAETSQGWQIA